MTEKQKAEKQKAEKKTTHGYNLSVKNVMWLRAKAFTLTMQQPTGTVSASQVLDDVVTAAREKEEKEGKKP